MKALISRVIWGSQFIDHEE